MKLLSRIKKKEFISKFKVGDKVTNIGTADFYDVKPRPSIHDNLNVEADTSVSIHRTVTDVSEDRIYMDADGIHRNLAILPHDKFYDCGDDNYAVVVQQDDLVKIAIFYHIKS